MANPYIEIFRTPGSFAFSAYGLIARCSLSMNTLSIVTMMSFERGHYALASAVATVYVVCMAAIAPQISKLADRYGQTRIAAPTTILTVLSMLALIAAVHYDAPAWCLFAAAAGMGLMPGFGAFVRARWSRLLHGTALLHTAFAYESTIDEVMFMAGPVLVIYLSTAFFPEAGLLGSALLLTVGAILFCLQKRTEPAVIVPAKRSRKDRPVIFMPPVLVIVGTLLLVGAIFGTAEVSAVALAKSQGEPARSMWPLSAYALGSFIAGIAYGALRLKARLPRQFTLAIWATALTTLPLFWVNTIEQMTWVLFIAGAACSPTIITAMKLIERLAPPEKMTEGITWALTGLTIGFAIGMSSAGQAIDRFSVYAGFYIAIGASFAALGLFLLCRRIVERGRAA